MRSLTSASPGTTIIVGLGARRLASQNECSRLPAARGASIPALVLLWGRGRGAGMPAGRLRFSSAAGCPPRGTAALPTRERSARPAGAASHAPPPRPPPRRTLPAVAACYAFEEQPVAINQGHQRHGHLRHGRGRGVGGHGLAGWPPMGWGGACRAFGCWDPHRKKRTPPFHTHKHKRKAHGAHMEHVLEQGGDGAKPPLVRCVQQLAVPAGHPASSSVKAMGWSARLVAHAFQPLAA